MTAPRARCRACLSLLTVLCAVGASACGASGSSTAASSSSSNAAPVGLVSSASTVAAAPRPRPPARPPIPPHAGALPQTPAEPSGHGAALRFVARALRRGVVHDSLAAGLPAFFPEAAYAQVKTVADPAGDFRSRLLGDYQLDLSAAHSLLGTDAAHARLVGVRVPMSYAHWVPPGVCANRLGYWEVPNARVIYREGGAEDSFGIASMISWRGVWYVVHLGAVLRPGAGGVVDDPSSGPGVSAYSSTC